MKNSSKCLKKINITKYKYYEYEQQSLCHVLKSFKSKLAKDMPKIAGEKMNGFLH